MIPKKIYCSWISKDILTDNHIFPKNTIQNLKKLSSSWDLEIYTDKDIDDYLKLNLDRSDYRLLSDRHIVEKSDVWRLLKLYNEGGLYTDIDRLVNTSLDNFITDNIKWVLPTFRDSDFSQDFMCSDAGNPVFLETLKMNLERRKGLNGTNIYYLGPQTYMHGITKTLFGEIIDVNPSIEIFNQIRVELSKLNFVYLYRETPPYNLVTYRLENPQVNFDHETMKRDYYLKCKLNHWTGNW